MITRRKIRASKIRVAGAACRNTRFSSVMHTQLQVVRKSENPPFIHYRFLVDKSS